MPTPEQARQYLGDALSRLGVDLAIASRAIGRNHAYLQQYVKYGKPRWLKEGERDALVVLYDLEAGQLQPAPSLAHARVPGDHLQQSKIDAPKLGKVVKDAGTLELIEIYADIEGDDARRMARQVLWGFTRSAATRTG